jgi:putative ABC transport system permease protein
VLNRIKYAVRALRGGRRTDLQLDDELQFHVDLEADLLTRQGVAPDRARTMALRKFGGVERVKEECRESRGLGWLDAISRTLRYAFRTLRRNPAYTLLSIVVLGLGIGANTAMFSVIHGVLLKPLPYVEGDRLMLIQQAAPLSGQDSVGVSIPELYDYRRELTSFSGLVEFHQMSFDLLNRGEPDRVATGVVSSNFFDVLGIRPHLGRTFVDTDDDHGVEAVLVLSHSYWRTRFGGDPSIVGQVFQMNDRPHTVIGVLPPVPHYPQECDVYMPTSACPFRAAAETRVAEQRRAFGALQVFGRLKPGAKQQEAIAAVRTVGQRFVTRHPETYRPALGFQASAADLGDELTRNARPLLLVLIGATGLVLLLACANIASLSLARALAREKEISLRAALGAGRRQIAAQLLGESLLLSIAGGMVGIVLAWSTLDALSRFTARFTTRVQDIAIDGTVLGFTLAVSVLTGIAFGAFPALLSRISPMGALKQSGAGGGSPERRRLQHVLVVAQVAASVVLLTGAGLLLASLHRLQQVDAGYRPERVLSAEIFGNFTRYRTAQDFLQLYEPLLARLSTEPGVISAAISNAVPLAQEQPFDVPFRVEGQAVDDPDRLPVVDVNIVSPAYFDTLGIRLVDGRGFQTTDNIDAMRVVMINRTMARYWGDRNPIGSRIRLGRTEDSDWLTVVGVVGDVRQYGLARDVVAQAYTPLSQIGNGLAGRVLLRTAGDPIAMAEMLRGHVRALDPNQPIENVQTLEQSRQEHLATPRLTALLLSLFAGVALLVTLAGITGVIATSVSQRTQEFGIRMALGASRTDVLGSVLRQGLALVVFGLVAGLALAAVFGQVLSSYLFQTEPTDPVALGAVALACLTAGAVACLGPARRATRVDPMLALRSE